MTSDSKNVSINKLDDIVNKCNNTYHITVKKKSVDVKPSTYIDFDKKNNQKGPIRISKYKNIFLQNFMLQIRLKKLL